MALLIKDTNRTEHTIQLHQLLLRQAINITQVPEKIKRYIIIVSRETQTVKYIEASPQKTHL